eukprot:1548095-Pyramimonas_sp.AAC.1
MYLSIWRDHPDVRSGVSRMWQTVVQHLQGVPERHRAKHVRGPVSAAVLHLIEPGWSVSSATGWGIPEPHEFA